MFEAASVSFDAGAEYGFYADGGDAGGADDHVFAGVYFGDGDVDEFFGGGFGHEFVAVPLLKVLDGGEADFFFVATVEGDVDYVFAGCSWHCDFVLGFRWPRLVLVDECENFHLRRYLYSTR